jgi:hypothetical protein
MSVYVGIDVHRKRSQVAVVTEDGTVQVTRNVPNGVEPILKSAAVSRPPECSLGRDGETVAPVS